ncbi:MAG: TlpA family protein disulfide reductase [Acidobacteria bacterium]|nr:TlpA family protein disulfide reductase [Acidobacteriota bacterium]
MKLHKIRVLTGILLLFFVAPWASAPAQSKKPASDPAIIDTRGYGEMLAKYRGKPILVNFWATWCEPCREEFPALVEVARAYQPQGLVVLGVSFDDDADINLVRRFLAKHNPPFPNVRRKMGTEKELVRSINPNWRATLPATCFYDREGRLVTQLIGGQSRAEFERIVQQLLQAPAPGKSK